MKFVDLYTKFACTEWVAIGFAADFTISPGGIISDDGRLEDRWENLVQKPPTIRVSGGTAKGRKLKRPDVYLRPMMSKVNSYMQFDHVRVHTIMCNGLAKTVVDFFFTTTCV